MTMHMKNPVKRTEGGAHTTASGCLLFSVVLFALIIFMIIPGDMCAGENRNVLIINSNASVKKYSQMQTAFKASFEGTSDEVDIGSKWFEEKAVEKTVRSTKPGLIFCIGSKAYVLAQEIAKDAHIIFSLGINWQRFPLTNNTYVIANEPPPVVELTTFRYLFPDIRRVGVIYSKTHNKEWIQTAMNEAKDVGIEIIGSAVKKDTEVKTALQNMMTKIDALWLIPDPVVLANAERVKEIFTLCDRAKKPVFSYDRLFADFGASLIISADITTMGKQAAQTAMNILTKKDDVEKIQNPAGSYIALDVKKIERYGIKLNSKALSSINELIE
jgi:putative ABC transport system substrate-binding protein